MLDGREIARLAGAVRTSVGGRWQLLLAVFVAAGVFALDRFGVFDGMNAGLRSVQFSIFESEATERLVVVDVDPEGLGGLGVWPLDGAALARAVTRLIGAGAEDIGLAVVPEPGPGAGRADFAAVLARAGRRLVVPASSGWAGSADRVFWSDPAEAGTAPNGPPGWYSFGSWSETGFLPSLAVALAGMPAAGDRGFLVDLGIRLDGIPRLSLSELVAGDEPGVPVAGRDVLIGPAASGPAAGPLSQAGQAMRLHVLAYQSLVMQRAIRPADGAVVLAGLAVLVVLYQWLGRQPWPRLAGGTLLLGASVVAAEAVAVQVFAVTLLPAAWLVSLLVCLVLGLVTSLETQGAQLFRQRMAVAHRDAVMRAVVEESFDGILLVDGFSRVADINPAGGELLGVASASVVGRPVGEVLPRLADLLPAAGAGGRTLEEISYPRHDGSGADLEVVVTRSRLVGERSRFERRQGDREVTILTFRDVTARRAAEAERRMSLERSESASRAKSEFLATMSHELRTPLNAIIGFADVMRRQQLGPLENAKYAEYVRYIQESGELLLDIINSILDASRLESGSFAIKEQLVDLPHIVADCERVFRGWTAGQRRRLTVTVADGIPNLWADPLILKQVILNLLSNAYKFTADDGEVALAVRELTDGRPAIEVTDDGVGISSGHLAQLFQAFYMADGSFARAHGGSGLGLYLVRKFVDLHQGEIEIRSEPGRGTWVQVALPLSRRRDGEARDLGIAKGASG